MKCQKCSIVAGILLFVLAALISVSLLLVAVDFGQISPAKNTIFYALGKMFTGVYGFTSICIPIFLIFAGVQCFNAKWRFRNGVVLIGSIVPFFTLDAIEHICRMIFANDSDTVMLVKISSTLLIGSLIIAAEYLLLSILGDVIENSLIETAETKELLSHSHLNKTDEEIPAQENEETDPADEYFENDEEIFFDEDEKTPARRKFFSLNKKNEPKEESLDLSKDRLFLEQKEVLKDLINDGKPGVKKPDDDATLVDEPTIIEHETFEDEQAVPESVTEEELLDEDDFAEPELPEEPSPFDHIFDQQKEIVEDETVVEEPEITKEAGFDAPAEESRFRDVAIPDDEDVESEDEIEAEEDAREEHEEPVFEEEPEIIEKETETETEIASDDFNEPVLMDEAETAEEPETETETVIDDFDEPASSEETEIAEEPETQTESAGEELNEPDFIEETEIPVNSEDFQDEFDEMDDVSPVSFDEPDYDDLSEEESHPEDEDFFEDIPDALQQDELPQDNLPEEDEPETEEDFDSDLDFEEVPDTEMELENEAEPETEEEVISEPDVIEYPEEDENPADFINIEDIAETQSENVQESAEDEPFETEEDEEEPLGVEDIFSQMEADAAANPVVKNPEEFAAKNNLAQPANTTANGEAEKENTPQIRKLSQYKIPTDLLEKFENEEYWRIDDETKAAGENLKQTLNEFGIEAEVTGIRKGPVVTMFELLPAPGVKLSKIVNLQDNIALALAAKSVRIVAPIPGRHAVGIEIPNKERAIVSFREIIEQNLPEYKKMAIPVILGKDISGQSQIIDIAKTPHLLIAGATGAGKSVCVNSIILSILYNRSPQDVKLIMVDPKVVELKLYNDIPHLLTPVVTEPKRALQVLQYCICEMERRYALLDGMGVRDIMSYNTRIRERRIATEKLPYIVVIIDEFADLMATSGKELETSVARLTAMSRAVGIHLVLATQRPSVNVITGLIKANIPSRIAFMVASRTDSNIIIDSVGAEKLLGKGDMLYTSAVNPIPTRIQGTLVGDNEVERVVDYVKSFGGPDYIDDEIFVDDDEDVEEEPGLFSDGEDPLYDQALQIVIQAGKASASYIQRRLKIGYNRAARLVEDMEARGIVGPANGSKPREVIHVP